MIRMHDLSARYDHHSNKYTMCNVQNDQVPAPHMHWDLIFYESIGAQLAIGAPCPCGTRLCMHCQKKQLTPLYIII